MKARHYLPLAAFSLALLAGCNSKKEAALTSGIDLANLDTTAIRGTDFYQYACGGWMKNHPLTDEYSQYGSFNELAENNNKQLKELITELAVKEHTPGSVDQKIGDLYNIAMDSVKLNKDGAAPILPMLQKIATMKSSADVMPMMAEMINEGVGSYFGFGVGADEKNSSMNIFQIGQGGIALGEREYYLATDSATQKIREEYKKHIVKMFQLVGDDEATATKKMQDILEIETAIAKASSSKAELRDPEANYHKMTLDEFKKLTPDMDWDTYLNAIGVKGVNELIVGQIAPLQEVNKLIKTLPVEKQIAYLQSRLISNAASYLSDDFRAEAFNFSGKVMSGAKEDRPRWKRAISNIDNVLGEAVGQMYVQKYFPAAAKERMQHLVKNLQTALGERITNLEWMGDSTKQKAIEKLNAFTVKVGYPDKWKDYSTLEIKNDSYWENMVRASQWQLADELSRIGKPVDKDEWLMTPQTVNAYYNPTTNEICFPAGILQPPFFDMNADDAFNYGAIGVVIGHEMTHGFDDQGRQYDKEGNLNDWWTATDAENFKERAQVMVDFFNNIEVLPGLHANGEITLGENIADHGGLKVSYQAFKAATKDAPLPVVDGFTPEQRFFLAYSNVWAANTREEMIRMLTRMDVHSLAQWRVNGALPHIQEWYDAFGITEGDSLYIAPEKRVSIW
ncbi:MAG: M13 family metallopeptidase [Bacteroides sp.]|nr:M13 family metallopeptidase [Bacteroides sp.]